MVMAHHLIWTAYGSWLPNDPRGSTSHEIRVEKIAELGELHVGRKAVQPSRTELLAFFAASRDVLAHEPLTFTPDDIQFVGKRLGETIQERGYTCYACAVMPDHVHLLIRRHRDTAEVMLRVLQESTREKLIAAERRGPTHPVWGGPGWKVFLDSRERIERVIKYIWNNPIKAKMPEQNWDFVTPYDGWAAGLITK